jgi:hypothetical protein
MVLGYRGRKLDTLVIDPVPLQGGNLASALSGQNEERHNRVEWGRGSASGLPDGP